VFRWNILGRINLTAGDGGTERSTTMYALTFPKTLTVLALSFAAFATASAAEAGVFVPGKHPDAIVAPGKHPDASKHPDFEPNIMGVFKTRLADRPDIIAILGSRSAGKTDVLIGLKKAPFMRKAGGDGNH
jgi:hypothetical protein